MLWPGVLAAHSRPPPGGVAVISAYFFMAAGGLATVLLVGYPLAAVFEAVREWDIQGAAISAVAFVTTACLAAGLWLAVLES